MTKHCLLADWGYLVLGLMQSSCFQFHLAQVGHQNCPYSQYILCSELSLLYVYHSYLFHSAAYILLQRMLAEDSVHCSLSADAELEPKVMLTKPYETKPSPPSRSPTRLSRDCMSWFLPRQIPPIQSSLAPQSEQWHRTDLSQLRGAQPEVRCPLCWYTTSSKYSSMDHNMVQTLPANILNFLAADDFKIEENSPLLASARTPATKSSERILSQPQVRTFNFSFQDQLRLFIFQGWPSRRDGTTFITRTAIAIF